MRHVFSRLSVFVLVLSGPGGAFAQGTLWQTYQDAGVKALNDDKLDEAERLIRAAMAEAAAFGEKDPYRRQATSYGTMAWILQRQKRYDDAKPLAEWGLRVNRIYEQQPGITTAYNMNTLAAIFRAQARIRQGRGLPSSITRNLRSQK